MKYVMLDTETSGLNPGQIAQLTYVITNEEFRVLKAYNQFFAVTEMTQGACDVHGLTLEKLKELSNGVTFKDVAEEVLEDLSDCRIITHNTAFDMKFLYAEFARMDMKLENADIFCTMKHFTHICNIPGKNGKPKWPKLVELLKWLNVEEHCVLNKAKELFKCEGNGFHDARVDVAGLIYAAYYGVKGGHM